jgi:hypothetical protein
MFVAKSESNKCEIFDDSLVCIEAGCNYNYLSKSCKEFPDLNQQCKVFKDSFVCLKAGCGYDYLANSCYEMPDNIKLKNNSSNYNISGTGNNGFVYGTIDTTYGRFVEGTLILEDGSNVWFDGEWTGNGMIDVFDENGNWYQLEVE